MSHIEESVEVAVPVRTAYNQWTQFEEFPRFMEGVDQVEQLNDTTLRWTADVAGRTKSWEAKITEQRPDQVVAWKSIGGAPNDGVVTFQQLDNEHTRVRLALDVDPQGAIESAGDALGFVRRRVEGDLRRFKEFIEHRGTQTGGWRGSVSGGARTENTSSPRSTSASSGTSSRPHGYGGSSGLDRGPDA
jgi:uncharacterized membrane protein